MRHNLIWLNFDNKILLLMCTHYTFVIACNTRPSIASKSKYAVVSCVCKILILIALNKTVAVADDHGYLHAIT